MRMEQVDWLKTFSTYLGIEIDPTWLETTVVEDRKHALGGQIDVGGELIGVPTQHHIARIGVNATQGTSGRCDLQFMLHGVAGQGRMIGFQVELEMSHQSILPEKIQASSSIGIILVFGRFLGLGLNVELAFEADLFLVVYRHVEKCGQMIHLAFELGIPECGISFPSSPEGVPLASKGFGDFNCLFHLCCCIGKHISIAAGGSPMHVTGMAKEAGRPPEQLDACASLFLLEHLGHSIQILVAGGQTGSLGSHIPIVKGVIRSPKFFHELESDPSPILSVLHRIGAIVPRSQGSAHTERVGQWVAESMPINHGEPQVVLHRLPFHLLILVVVFEGQWVLGIRTFVGDLFDFRKGFLCFFWHTKWLVIKRLSIMCAQG